MGPCVCAIDILIELFVVCNTLFWLWLTTPSKRIPWTPRDLTFQWMFHKFQSNRSASEWYKFLIYLLFRCDWCLLELKWYARSSCRLICRRINTDAMHFLVFSQPPHTSSEEQETKKKCNYTPNCCRFSATVVVSIASPSHFCKTSATYLKLPSNRRNESEDTVRELVGLLSQNDYSKRHDAAQFLSIISSIFKIISFLLFPHRFRLFAARNRTSSYSQ